MSSVRFFILILVIGVEAQALDNYSIPNCTTVPQSGLSYVFIYWSTVAQTFLSVAQLVGGPANFIADRIFYEKHNSPKVKQEGQKLAAQRGRHQNLKHEGYGIVCNKITMIMSLLNDESSNVVDVEKTVRELNAIGAWLDLVADSNDPVAEEALAQ